MVAEGVETKQPVIIKTLVNVSLADVISLKHSHTVTINAVEKFVATAGQTIFTTAEAYEIGSDNLWVFKNGIKKEKNDDYIETSSNTFTMLSGCLVGDKITVVIYLTAIIEVI